MDEQLLKEKLSKFECQRCNECCRKPGFVYLDLDEAQAISDFLKMDLRDFTDQYCELQDRRRLVLKKHPDEACIFLDPKGCTIHPVKPRQCQEFPLKWRTPASFDYCAGLRKIF